MEITRREALKTMAAAPLISRPSEGQPDLNPAMLAALAEVVLPAESDRIAAVAAFVSWLDNYKEGADTDHGYGNTRVRAMGPSPGWNYPAQILDMEARALLVDAASFATASVAQRRTIVEAAIAAAKIERLPARPNGGHIATDLMGHYFNSSAANDLCYQAAINRDACRGLAGSENPPAPRASRLPPRAPRPAPRDPR